jgi:predicted permease
MDAEMRYHLELEAQELMERGVPRDEARRQAALAFGGVQQQKEEAFEQGPWAWLDNMRRNVRIAVRTLRRHPSFAITATLALALAIAVNTTMFSVLDAMMNPHVGARQPDRLFELKYFGDPKLKVDFAARRRALEASSGLHQAYTEWFVGRTNTVEHGAHVDGTQSAKVHSNFFATLGIAPIEGRLSPGGDAASITSSVVISSRLRAALFAPTESPVGKSISLDGQPYTVIGVTDRYAIMAPLDYDLWTFALPSEYLIFKIVRLKDGLTLHDAERQLAQLAAQIARAAGESIHDSGFQLIPLAQQFHVSRFHYVLIGAGLAILLIAFTNLANLQLARGLTRSPELAVRSSLGASRRQIVTQLLLESAIVAAVALALALLFALAGNMILRATVPPSVGDNVIEPHGSWRMVAFASLAAVTGLLSIGLLPAIRVSLVDLNSLLKGRAGTGAHRSNRRLYGALIVVQIALTLPLASAAVLLSREAMRVADMDYLIRESFGYDPRPMVRVVISLPAAPFGTKVSLADKAAEILSHARATPGVSEAAITQDAQLKNTSVTVDDDGALREVEAPMWGYTLVTPGYFRTFGLTMAQGRDLTEGGHGEGLVVMDARSAKYLWPRSGSVGHTIKFADMHDDAPPMRVEGIITDRLSDDARQRQDILSLNRIGKVYRLITTSDSIMLSPYRTTLTLNVRASGVPQDVAEALRRNLRSVSATPPLVALRIDYLGIPQMVRNIRFIAAIFSTFGILGLGLSALGVYAIVAQSVTDRRREVAVRMSLGASPRNIVYTLLREGNVIVLAGIASGLLLTRQIVSWLGPFMTGTDEYSAPFFGAMCVALFVAMVLSALVPAIRATQLDPMEVLRAE